MKTFSDQMNTYKQQHTHKINQLTHLIGIPMIIFGIAMGLNWISLDISTKAQFSFSWILLAYALIYYFRLNIKMAAAATITLIPFTFIATLIARPAPTHFSFTLFLILFLGGWALQFIGHFFEKQRPAFMISASQLLIGPLFVLTKIIEVLHIEKYFD